MLYIAYNKIDKASTIFDVDGWFDVNFHSLPETKENKRLIKEIDHAELISADTVRTPFGVTSLSNLSSGCKAALLAANTNYIVSFDEAGDNAFEAILKTAKAQDIKIATSLCVSVNSKDTVVVDGVKMSMMKFCLRSASNNLL